MKLKELILIEDDELKVTFPLADASMDIKSLTSDSREVIKNGLFAALRGVGQNGADYIEGALEKGAAAILCHPSDRGADGKITWMTSKNTRHSYAKLAAKFYNSQPDNIAAITGTNGKTSIASFTAQIWSFLGKKSATIGTLGVQAEGYEKYTGLTTPDAAILQKSLRDLKKRGAEYVALEASSHGLDQSRLDGVHISAAAFCNLTQDHFDYHGNFANYFKAKEHLFSHLLPEGGAAVLNHDCEYFEKIKKTCSERGHKIITVGTKKSDIWLKEQKPTLQGQDIKLRIYWRQDYKDYALSLSLVGDFQAMNLLMAVGLVMGINPDQNIDEIIAVLGKIKPVKGRMEYAANLNNGAGIYVDYAHTPDALKVALKALRKHVKGQLHVVFGCGGDRDISKRTLMGQIAETYADKIYVTDDNPRSEEPAVIRAMVIEGCKSAKNIQDRRDAIFQAVKNLNKGDLLLVAGKGHEQGQLIGKVNFEFDDVTEVKKAAAMQNNADVNRKKPI